MPSSEDFTTNMLRMICASVYSSACMQTAREMFGKSYFALGVAEKVTVDQTTLMMIASNYQNVTPEVLASQVAPKPTGFRIPDPEPEKHRRPYNFVRTLIRRRKRHCSNALALRLADDLCRTNSLNPAQGPVAQLDRAAVS